ncbi:MAG TPA: hypothetical protein VHE54_06070 [Puia sp.]|nr:hypothetical protein [Puia sp.]
MKALAMNKWNNTVLQCLFGIASLILFAPQLSYKFYVCANSPSWTSGTHFRATAHQVRVQASSIADEHCRPLSIDKRYDWKHLFALPPARSVAAALRRNGPARIAGPVPALYPGFRSAGPPMRGPPRLSNLS